MSRHAERSDLAERMAEQFVRHAIDLRFPRLSDAALAASFRILAEPDLAAGQRALPVLAALDARHQRREWAGSSTGYVCTAGCGAYPCPDRRILDGQLAAVAS